MKVSWMKGSAFNFGRIEGKDYRCERFSRPDGSLWFLLSSAKKTYLCCRGPFQTKEERDLTQDENNQVDGLLTEVDELDTKIERAEKMETIKRNAAVVSGVSVWFLVSTIPQIVLSLLLFF